MGKYGGKVIHCCYDGEGPIEVVESYGVRSLHFGSTARQSAMALANPDHIELPYLRAMLVGLVFVPAPARILILGLGGGSLPRFLLQQYPETVIEVVESRAAMVGVAREYFGLADGGGLIIRIADAGEYLQQRLTEGHCQYDLILVDVFDDQGLAPMVIRHDFFEALASLVNFSGVVGVNLWSGHAESFRAVMRLLKRCFPTGVYTLPVVGRGNVIGLGLEATLGVPRLKGCLARAQSLELRTGIEFSRLLQGLSPSLGR
jgi:spermidine synthase